MKICTKCKEVKSLTEYSKRGESLQYSCKSCQKLMRFKNRKNNPEREKRKSKEYYLVNKNKHKESRKAYSKANREKFNAATKRWAQKHSEKNRNRKKIWVKNNPGLNTAKAARYTAQKIRAMPSWLTESQVLQIKEFYIVAQQLKLLNKKNFHVDHIVPLRGKGVCGLHVPWNLQILTSFENISKGNKF